MHEPCCGNCAHYNVKSVHSETEHSGMCTLHKIWVECDEICEFYEEDNMEGENT